VPAIIKVDAEVQGREDEQQQQKLTRGHLTLLHLCDAGWFDDGDILRCAAPLALSVRA